jgi:hypothetical protein
LNGRDRFLAALAGQELAFAPIVWEQLPELVHQEQAGWWQDPNTGQRLIADAAALSLADAMFIFAAAEAVGCAVSAGAQGDQALDSFIERPEVANGAELVRCLHEVAAHAVIAALPTPSHLLGEFKGEETETAEDAFADLASAFLRAGADALAVTGREVEQIEPGVRRAAELGKLFGRPVLGIRFHDGGASGWTAHGGALGVVSDDGSWPPIASGIVITPGDVSGRWDASTLRAVGSARP